MDLELRSNKMTQSFDNAWKENRHVWESTKNLAKAMYLAGAQSRQAEIDELNNRINRLEEDLRKAHNTIRSKSRYSIKWGEN